jgi:hypothetical protein
LDRAELEAELPKESRVTTLKEVPFRIDGVIAVRRRCPLYHAPDTGSCSSR